MSGSYFAWVYCLRVVSLRVFVSFIGFLFLVWSTIPSKRGFPRFLLIYFMSRINLSLFDPLLTFCPTKSPIIRAKHENLQTDAPHIKRGKYVLNI